MTIPEPGPLSLLLFGLAAIGVVRKKASPLQYFRHLTISFWGH
ncbi:MAG: PEP-CTERM sorting domain-containing protein [Candidatus Thiodiazotropha sp. (ex Myrtea spinifera)]|nr:PEP-CTERM sorting domain-containing protein [Candidatus Thiodiazotropha sp. (ex Myrtea spinifera)]